MFYETTPSSVYAEFLRISGLEPSLKRLPGANEVVWSDSAGVPEIERGQYEEMLIEFLYLLDDYNLNSAVSRIELFTGSLLMPRTCLVVVDNDDAANIRTFKTINRLGEQCVDFYFKDLGCRFRARRAEASGSLKVVQGIIGPEPKLEAIARF